MQAAIAPATIISGIAFLLSIIAVRYGRCIDRVRELLGEIQNVSEEDALYKRLFKQIQILYRRARLLRNTMVFAAVSIFWITVTMICIFGSLMFELELKGLALVTFVLALLSLVVTLALFIRDILVSLKALKLEILARSPTPVKMP